MAFTSRVRVRIDAPREAVWPLVADPKAHPRWREELVEMALEEGEPAAEGAVYKEVIAVGPRHVVSRFRITATEAPARFVFEVFEPEGFPSTNTVRLDPTATGCAVEFLSLNRTRGWRRLVDPLWRRLFDKSLERELGNLRDVATRAAGGGGVQP
ncbi:MAG: SRPBCC family protein [Nitriliruptorales bacterium]|nr:SRPBCC family protein [Nitriliruptorales bacterium]